MYMSIITSSDPPSGITPARYQFEKMTYGGPSELGASGVIGSVMWKGGPVLIRTGLAAR